MRISVAKMNGIKRGEKLKKIFFESWKIKSYKCKSIRHLTDDEKGITDIKEIDACICNFYKNLFKIMSLNQISRANRF